VAPCGAWGGLRPAGRQTSPAVRRAAHSITSADQGWPARISFVWVLCRCTLLAGGAGGVFSCIAERPLLWLGSSPFLLVPVPYHSRKHYVLAGEPCQRRTTAVHHKDHLAARPPALHETDDLPGTFQQDVMAAATLCIAALKGTQPCQTCIYHGKSMSTCAS
jgi:hypothetical protein